MQRALVLVILAVLAAACGKKPAPAAARPPAAEPPPPADADKASGAGAEDAAPSPRKTTEDPCTGGEDN